MNEWVRTAIVYINHGNEVKPALRAKHHRAVETCGLAGPER